MNLYEDVFVCHCLFVGPTKTCAFLTLFVVKLSHWVKNIEKKKEEDYKRVENHSCFESLIRSKHFSRTHKHTSQGVEKNGCERVHAKKLLESSHFFPLRSPFTTINCPFYRQLAAWPQTNS
jgi:hypothetical protein